MLDIRGVGNRWHDVVIPGLDYVLVERTLGKEGPEVEVLTKLPENVQHLVGKAYSSTLTPYFSKIASAVTTGRSCTRAVAMMKRSR